MDLQNLQMENVLQSFLIPESPRVLTLRNRLILYLASPYDFRNLPLLEAFRVPCRSRTKHGSRLRSRALVEHHK